MCCILKANLNDKAMSLAELLACQCDSERLRVFAACGSSDWLIAFHLEHSYTCYGPIKEPKCASSWLKFHSTWNRQYLNLGMNQKN